MLALKHKHKHNHNHNIGSVNFYINIDSTAYARLY